MLAQGAMFTNTTVCANSVRSGAMEGGRPTGGLVPQVDYHYVPSHRVIQSGNSSTLLLARPGGVYER